MGSYLVGIRSRRASPCQSAVLLLGKPSGGEDDPSHTHAEGSAEPAQRWRLPTSPLGTEPTQVRRQKFRKNRPPTPSSGSSFARCRKRCGKGEKRWSDTNTNSRARTPVSTITLLETSLGKLAFQSELFISFSGKLCS